MATRTILRTRQVAERTGISQNTLRWWRSQGRGPRSFSLGRRMVVYDAADVDAWLDAQRAAGDDRRGPS